ncbi:MAG: phosphoglycerate kinase, partial [Armatimonadota bacterium]
MARKSISEIDPGGRRTLVRVDFNVPLEDGAITDVTRIKGALPTIEALIEAGCPITLCSHMGRPAGERDESLSLSPVAEKLSEFLGSPVRMAPDCIGDEVAQMRADLGAGEVLLLENTRFHAGEKANDADFAEALAGDAERYVDDAFGSMHRAHASTVGVTECIDECVAGLLVREELDRLSTCREAEGDGFIVILGGAKAEDKIKAIQQLLPRVEKLLIGGAMAWAFFKVMG